MKQIIRIVAPLTLIALGRSETWAHPGHGDPGAAHYIIEPEHRIVVVTAILAIGLTWWVARKVALFSSRRPTRITPDRTHR